MKIYMGVLGVLKEIVISDDDRIPDERNTVRHGPIEPPTTYIRFEQADGNYVVLRIHQSEFWRLKEAVDMVHATRTTGKAAECQHIISDFPIGDTTCNRCGVTFRREL